MREHITHTQSRTLFQQTCQYRNTSLCILQRQLWKINIRRRRWRWMMLMHLLRQRHRAGKKNSNSCGPRKKHTRNRRPTTIAIRPVDIRQITTTRRRIRLLPLDLLVVQRQTYNSISNYFSTNRTTMMTRLKDLFQHLPVHSNTNAYTRCYPKYQI